MACCATGQELASRNVSCIVSVSHVFLAGPSANETLPDFEARGADTGELLGAHMIGPDVSELLPELTLAQKWDLTALEAARNVHTHPTLSEALQEAFHGIAGHMINI